MFVSSLIGQIPEPYRFKQHIVSTRSWNREINVGKLKKQPTLRNFKDKRKSQNSIIMPKNMNMLNINCIMQNKNSMLAADK